MNIKSKFMITVIAKQITKIVLQQKFPRSVLNICIISCLLLSGCVQPGWLPVKITRPLLGTIVEITVADQDKPRRLIIQGIEKAFAELARMEQLYSKYKSESEIYQINTQGCLRPVRVGSETIELLEKAILLSRLTGGAFDISVSPLIDLWARAERYQQRIPEPAELQAALLKVDYRHIDIDSRNQSVFLTQQAMSLDLGGIAKGYAVDRAIAVLKQEGIRSVLINAGGDIYALGRPEKNKKWQIGLQHPREKEGILRILELEDKAVATSGDYQRYFEIAGRRYCHIINPQTGLPCRSSIISATVLSADCLTADALATSLFVLGKEKGLKLINQLENTEAILVTMEEEKLDILLSQGLTEELTDARLCIK